MLLGSLSHFLEMFIIAVFCQPSNDIPVGPVDLESVRVLVVNVVLDGLLLIIARKQVHKTYIDGHLIDMHPLLNSEFGNKNIESSIQHTNNSGLTNNGAVSLREVRNQDTEEQMSRLLLSQLRRVPLATERKL